MAIELRFEYAKLRMSMRLGNARYSADPVGLGAQSDPIGAGDPISIEGVLAAPELGAYTRVGFVVRRSR